MRVAVDMDGMIVCLYQAVISLYGLPGNKLAHEITTGGSIAGVLTRSYWGAPRLNVILVTLDTTRADRMEAPAASLKQTCGVWGTIPA